MEDKLLHEGTLLYTLDVAIVGAGASGIYSAYRLLNDKEKTIENLKVFDLSDRIGGRLYSKKLEEIDYYSELGGMRYITSQRLITSLIEGDQSPIKSKITPVDFPMGTDGSKLISYLRGERFLQSEFGDENIEFRDSDFKYNLRKEDIGLSADQLFSKVIYLVLAQSKWFIEKYSNCIRKVSEFEYEIKLNHKQWLDVKNNLTYNFSDTPYEGMKVNDIGFWNLIKDLIGQEGYNYLAEAGGYYSNTINWNAAEAFEYMIGDFAPNVQYKTLKEGFNKIILELAKVVDSNLEIDTEGFSTVKNIEQDTTIKMLHRLNAVQKVPENQVSHYLEYHDRKGRAITPEPANYLTLQKEVESVYILTFDILNENGEAVDWIRVKADKVILGMPRRSLELLMTDNEAFLNSSTLPERAVNFDNAYRSVIKEPSYKLLMLYRDAWWQKKGISTGHSITDLPMRQCYYFPSNHDFKISNKSEESSTNNPGNAVLLSSYGDMVTQSFWKALSDQPLNTEAYSLLSFSEPSDQPESKHYEVVSTNSAFAKEIQKQLQEVHGIKNIQTPYKIYFKDWTDDPYGAGYHAWKATVNVPKTREFLRNIFHDGTFHIVGEAYSTQQGWVEGAFFEAERVMKDHFQLNKPSWFAVDKEGTISYEEYMYPEEHV